MPSSVSAVPLPLHPCPRPLGPPWRLGGMLGLGPGQGVGPSLGTWGSWAGLWVRPYEEQWLWGGGLEGQLCGRAGKGPL